MTTRLRVAQVTLGLELGGQERLLVEMARHRDRERFDWTVVVLGGRGILADALEEVGVRVLALDAQGGFRPGLWRQLAALFRRERFDLVHTHDDRPLVYAMPAAWWAGVQRRVHTHHHGRLDHVRGRQLFLVRQAARFAQHFVCVSQDSAKYMAQEGIDPARVQTICNGIDLARFPFAGPSESGPIVTVARLSPEKDVANLVRAVPHVLAREPGARFEIAGDGPCRAELIDLAKELGVAERVVFHGAVGDIPKLLAEARLFVLPSQAEGISLTLLEAMACGLPVVATRVGGNPEVVEVGATGLLVPPRDPAALADAMLTCIADPDLASRMGRAGRQRVENLFDVRKMIAQYESIYVK